MSTRKKKAVAAAKVPRARTAHSRQRQRLIDACISALHTFGPSRTTVEKVVAIAKMSPGIVRFYFDSKAAMLIASLQFLAAEFEERLMLPVARLESNPVAALDLMVDLYLDPEIASARKVSVWYSFWGEASSRQEYYDICGQKDESFAVLVRDLVERLIVETGQSQLDPDGVALGLIGVLEMLWQDFAFQSEENIDRHAAKRRCMAYLRSIFPGRFAASPGRSADSGFEAGAHRLPAWVYDSPRLYSMERESLFQNSWQLVGHEAQIPRAGDFLTVDTAAERALVLRNTSGEVRAFRNACGELPHILVAASAGHAGAAIECAVHGLKFGLDGKPMESQGTADLSALDLLLHGGLIFVRSRQSARGTGAPSAWLDVQLPPGLRPAGPRFEASVAADWKLIAEQWLAAHRPPVPDALGWTQGRYLELTGSPALQGWKRQFMWPNQWIEIRPDGVSILQVQPVAAGRSLLRRFDYTLLAAVRAARAVQYLAGRLSPHARRTARALAESAQQGLAFFGYEAGGGAAAAHEVVAFRRRVVECLPAIAFDRRLDDP